MTGTPVARLQFGRRGRMTIALCFLLLILTGGAALFTSVDLDQEARRQSHTRETRETQALLFQAVEDAESAQRGYLLTGQPAYLAPFDRAVGRLPPLEERLMRQLADDPARRRDAGQLIETVHSKMAELSRTVALAGAGDRDGALALVRSDQGRRLMDELRARSRAFDAAQRVVFDHHRLRGGALRDDVRNAIILALALVCTLAGVVWLEIRGYIAELAQRYAALLREVEQRERVEEQLRQSQKMEALGQLTGGIAHDFNNMLAIIVGNLDMMLRRLGPEDARVRTMAENALTGATRAASLTKRLLAFSRRQALDPRTTDINRCVADMSEMLREVLGGAVVVETVLAGGLWRALVDRPELESAILNLAVNARDAMASGGRLTLETANAVLDAGYAAENPDVEPGQFVMIAVTDTGEGMTAETISRAFDPFYTTKNVGEGTGLGLSQVHGFIRQSRGHVKLYSEPGVGTTVRLYLPRDHSDAMPTLQAARVDPVRDNSRFKVLIVEDDPGVRGFAVSAARELGYAVVEADGAAAALERLAETPDISVLLTDVVMPGVNGRQLADSALALRPGLPIVFMTGYTRNAIVHNGALDPGVRLLTKPFTIADLDRELEQACPSPR